MMLLGMAAKGRLSGAVRVVLLTAAAILFATGAARAESAAAGGALTWVGTDGRIYYCAASCAEPVCVTCPVKGLDVRAPARVTPASTLTQQPERPRAQYNWPTFSPDGKQIAYSSMSPGRDGMTYGLWVYDIATRQRTQLFESRTEGVIYVYWLSDGKRLSFLANRPDGLSLMLAEVRQGAPLRIVTTGMPLFFDWKRTHDRLALHTVSLGPDRTEQVALMSLSETDQQIERVLSSGRTPFKTPCWSPDGTKLAYIARTQAHSHLVVSDPDAQEPRSLVNLPVGENSFIWSPDSRYIAYSTSVGGRDPLLHGVKIVDVASGKTRRLTSDSVAAWFFSPDSRHLLYIDTPTDKPYYTWKVVELKSGKPRALANFLTTSEEALTYRFFEQLALSHTIWSPDSKAFVYAGLPVTGEPSKSSGPAPPPTVWVVPIDGGAARAVAHGTLAFFSPAAAD